MEIARKKYLNDLIIRMNNGMIKVITGIRRAGKSYLLFKLFNDYLLSQGVPDSHILKIELDLRENKDYRKPDVILNYIKSLIQDNGKYFILLDEVQMLDDFEEVLNSLLHISNVDVYVTGSNSRFLSKDIITEFRGRGDQIHVYPLTFKEFMQVYQGDMYHAWADYILYGGLPFITKLQTEEQKINYLANLFEETYIKDIVEHHNIMKTQELEDLINILSSQIGSLTNASKIQQTFKSAIKSKISINTIKQYLDYLEDAFVISKAYRYDVKGRKYIGSPLKYYFEDIGLRNARIGFRQVEENHIMENIIYNELRYRGFNVDVGVVEKREAYAGESIRKSYEIDFIANLGNKRYYIQSAFSLSFTEKEHQEKLSLLNVNDSFKKIILVKDITNIIRDEHGIVTMNIYDFLLNDNSLDL